MMKTEYPASSRAFLYMRILYSNSKSQIARRGRRKYEAQLGAMTMRVALTIILIEFAGWPALTCSLQMNLRRTRVTRPLKLVLPVVPSHYMGSLTGTKPSYSINNFAIGNVRKVLCKRLRVTP